MRLSSPVPAALPVAFVLLAVVLSACGPRQPDATPRADFIAAPEGDPQDLSWEALLPEGEFERIQAMYDDAAQALEPGLGHDEAAPAAGQIGTFAVVDDLEGRHVRMPGYLMPLDLREGGAVSEYLLVPYYGACVHYPPPPPNQVVHVLLERPAQAARMWEARWVEGVMTLDRADTEFAAAAYTLHLSKSGPYRGP